MSTFADEIEQDYHQELLERGNLAPKPRPSWTGENQWTSLGYVAKINRIRCTCGACTDTLIGVFHRERTPSGKIRLTPLADSFQLPGDHTHPVEVTDLPARVCAYCLTPQGFERF